MTRRLEFSSRATGDLNSIWDYTSDRWGREQAHRYVASLVSVCRKVLSGEVVARKIVFSDAPYLRVRSGSHVVFFFEAEDSLVVVRVLHVRQDAEIGLS